MDAIGLDERTDRGGVVKRHQGLLSEYYVHLHFSHARVALALASTAKNTRRRSVGDRALRAMTRAAAPQSAFDLDSHVFYLFTQILVRRNRDLAAGLNPLSATVPQWRILP